MRLKGLELRWIRGWGELLWIYVTPAFWLFSQTLDKSSVHLTSTRSLLSPTPAVWLRILRHLNHHSTWCTSCHFLSYLPFMFCDLKTALTNLGHLLNSKQQWQLINVASQYRYPSPAGLLLKHIYDVLNQQVPLQAVNAMPVEDHLMSAGWASESASRWGSPCWKVRVWRLQAKKQLEPLRLSHMRP